MPSAVAPVFALTGVTMPIVVTNLVLIEQVFSVPGVFTGMRRGIAAGDFDLLFGLTAVAAGLVAVSSLATDVVLAWLDPRVRAQGSEMSARAWTGFAALSLLWGVPYLFIKVAVDGGMSPAFIAWVRVVLAAAILLALAKRAGVLSSVRGYWRWLAVYALIEIAIPFPLIAAGEQHVSSSLAAILIAAVPLFVALLAIRFDQAERASGRRLAGLLIGLARRRRADGDRRRGQARRAARRRGDPRRRPRLRRRRRWCSSASSRTSTRAPRWARASRSQASR